MSALGRAREVVLRLGGPLAVSRLERRVAKRSSVDLVQWAESTTAAVGWAFGDWQSSGRQESLDEARMGTAALLTVLEELERRRAAGAL